MHHRGYLLVTFFKIPSLDTTILLGPRECFPDQVAQVICPWPSTHSQKSAQGKWAVSLDRAVLEWGVGGLLDALLAPSTPSRLRLAICFCRFLVQLPGLFKVVVVTDVKVHIKGPSVAVSTRSEGALVEDPVYAHGSHRVDILGSVSIKGADASWRQPQ